MILDFKEMPQANGGDGMQDAFELFARDFLEVLGYKILHNPDRGADGKKDLIVREARQGISGISYIEWLVSCKHYAHSGNSVSDTNEQNIRDRVETHNCNGFMGFYSTIPAVSLSNNLNGLRNKIEFQIFDREKIEKTLLGSLEGIKLANRYFPISYGKYVIENPKPAKIFSDELEINCEYCGKNLLETKFGIFAILREFLDFTIDELSKLEEKEFPKNKYLKAYFSCKGECDYILKNKYLQQGHYIDEWCDILNYLHPTRYIKKMMAWLNSLNDGEHVENAAFDKLKKLMLYTFPYISREQTTEEKEMVKHYMQIGFEEFL